MQEKVRFEIHFLAPLIGLHKWEYWHDLHMAIGYISVSASLRS